jgi:hypothetical protein
MATLPESIQRFSITSDDLDHVQGDLFGLTHTTWPESDTDYTLRIGQWGYALSRQQIEILRDTILLGLST